MALYSDDVVILLSMHLPFLLQVVKTQVEIYVNILRQQFKKYKKKLNSDNTETMIFSRLSKF